jgi:hypothetical protein
MGVPIKVGPSANTLPRATGVIMENTVRTREGPILAQMRRFSAAHGKGLTVAGIRWRYYRLGSGPAVAGLTGGLRRAALGFAFLELMASRYTVLAPDYPPLRTVAEFDRGLSDP